MGDSGSRWDVGVVLVVGVAIRIFGWGKFSLIETWIVRIVNDAGVVVVELKLRFRGYGRIQCGPASEFVISTFAIALTLADRLTSTLTLAVILTVILTLTLTLTLTNAHALTETGATLMFVLFPTPRPVLPSSR